MISSLNDYADSLHEVHCHDDGHVGRDWTPVWHPRYQRYNAPAIHLGAPLKEQDTTGPRRETPASMPFFSRHWVAIANARRTDLKTHRYGRELRNLLAQWDVLGEDAVLAYERGETEFDIDAERIAISKSVATLLKEGKR